MARHLGGRASGANGMARLASVWALWDGWQRPPVAIPLDHPITMAESAVREQLSKLQVGAGQLEPTAAALAGLLLALITAPHCCHAGERGIAARRPAARHRRPGEPPCAGLRPLLPPAPLQQLTMPCCRRPSPCSCSKSWPASAARWRPWRRRRRARRCAAEHLLNCCRNERASVLWCCGRAHCCFCRPPAPACAAASRRRQHRHPPQPPLAQPPCWPRRRPTAARRPRRRASAWTSCLPRWSTPTRTAA